MFACGSDSGSEGRITPPDPEDGVLVTFTWTAVGDDNRVGTADQYDLRYSLDSTNLHTAWASTAPVSDLPAPATSGSAESLSVHLNLLPDTRYYFGVKVADEAGNWSRLSNITSVRTPPDTTTKRRDR
jgi:chitodextrinase